MKLTSIPTGYIKLDGGAMFGMIPKRIWQKLNPPDENNLCSWECRCLLIQYEGANILVDTGMGDYHDAKFLSHFEPHGDASLMGSLAKAGLQPDDITDVFITHLHFDHVGGAVRKTEDGQFVPAFPNATYWTNQRHYDWAYDANDREKASFLKHMFVPLKEAGQLQFIPVDDKPVRWKDHFRVHYVYGHTEAMMLLEIDTGSKTVLYAADLLPSSHHVRMPYIMGYDLRALSTLEEKKRLLPQALEQNWLIFFEHDPEYECGYLGLDAKGRIHVAERMSLVEGLVK